MCVCFLGPAEQFVFFFFSFSCVFVPLGFPSNPPRGCLQGAALELQSAFTSFRIEGTSHGAVRWSLQEAQAGNAYPRKSWVGLRAQVAIGRAVLIDPSAHWCMLPRDLGTLTFGPLMGFPYWPLKVIHFEQGSRKQNRVLLGRASNVQPDCWQSTLRLFRESFARFVHRDLQFGPKLGCHRRQKGE